MSARGYVLIFALWILAAIAATLAAASLLGRGASKVPEAQLRSAIEAREIVGVLDYVLRYTQDFDPRVDPRYAAYRKVMAEHREELAKSEDMLALLKALLAQMQWNLEIAEPKKKKDAEKDDAKKKDTAEEAEKKSRAALTHQSRRFFPRKEPYRVDLGERSYEVHIHPINALPNLNLLEREPLERYLRHLGLPERGARALAAVVIDWRDADEFITEGGAETDYYRQLPEPYAPRNAPLRSWREAAYLKQMTPELLRLLRENFTLHSRAAYPYVEYAPAAAIAALADLTASVAQDALENYRAALAATEGKPPELKKIVTEADEEKFLLASEQTADERLLQIAVKGRHARLAAVFDLGKREIVEYWTD